MPVLLRGLKVVAFHIHFSLCSVAICLLPHPFPLHGRSYHYGHQWLLMTEPNRYCLYWTLLHLILSSLVNLVFWRLFSTRFQLSLSCSTISCIFVTPYPNFFPKLWNNCSTNSWTWVATCFLQVPQTQHFQNGNHHFLQQTCPSFCNLLSLVIPSFQATIQTKRCFSLIVPLPHPHIK